MSERCDMQQYALDQLIDAILGNGRESADDLKQRIEDEEGNFDFDSFAPYTHQEIECIEDYESEFFRDAEDFMGGDKQYTASEWAEARRTYACAIGYAAFGHYFHEAKTTITDAIDELASDDALADVEEPQFELSRTCTHGWAPHDRESADGIHYWEPAQLEGCKAIAKQVEGVWITCTWTPEPKESQDDNEGTDSGTDQTPA
jgi:hypothetical protein